MICAATVANMVFQYTVHVVGGFARVPNSFRVNDHAGAEFAAVQTSGSIDPDALQFHFLCLGFHILAKFKGSFFLAATTPVAFFAFVDAKEYVVAKK